MEGRFIQPTLIHSDPNHDHDTYIVQIPKNQIYRIPPPENALIVDQHRNPTKPKSSRRSSSCLCFCLCLLLLLVLLVAALAVIYFLFKPHHPLLSITHVAVHHAASLRAPPSYVVSLTANNPNANTRLHYLGSTVDLYYDEEVVASGKFPALEQGPGDSTKVTVELAGSKNRPLDPEMKKSMDEKSGGKNVHIRLDLETKLEVKGRLGKVALYGMKPTMNCTMLLSSLRKDAHVLSQECKPE